MTILEQKPLTLSVPLREEPPGVLRVGKAASSWNWSFMLTTRENPPKEL